jgi:hypothetical protein
MGPVRRHEMLFTLRRRARQVPGCHRSLAGVCRGLPPDRQCLLHELLLAELVRGSAIPEPLARCRGVSPAAIRAIRPLR